MTTGEERVRAELQLRLLEALESVAASDPEHVAETLARFEPPDDDIVAVRLVKVLATLLPRHEDLALRFVDLLLNYASDMVIYSALDLAGKIAASSPDKIWPRVKDAIRRKTSADEPSIHVNDHPWGGLLKLIGHVARTDPEKYIPEAIELIVELNKTIMKPEVAADPDRAARFDWPTIMIMGWNSRPSIKEDDLVFSSIARPLVDFIERDREKGKALSFQLLTRREPFARRSALWGLARLAGHGDEESLKAISEYLDSRRAKDWSLWTTAHAQLPELVNTSRDWVLDQLEEMLASGARLSPFDAVALSQVTTGSSRARELLTRSVAQDKEVCKTALSILERYADDDPEFAASILTTAMDVLSPEDEDLVYTTRGIVQKIAVNDFSLMKPLLQRMVETENLSRRSLLADELTDIAAEVPAAVDQARDWLHTLSRDAHPHTRESVASAMRKFREIDPEFAFSLLTELAQDHDPEEDCLDSSSRSPIVVKSVRGHAASALITLAPTHTQPTFELLLRLARDPVDIVRWLALSSLEGAFANWEGAQASMKELLDPSREGSLLYDRSPAVRYVALHLAFYPAAYDSTFAEAMTPVLSSIASSAGGEIRDLALDIAIELALRHDKRELRSLLDSTLTSSDSTMRKRAAQRLRTIADRSDDFERLNPLLLSLSRDPDPGVREEVALGWSHWLEQHPNQVRLLVLEAVNSMREHGFGDPAEHYWAMLLHLLGEILESFAQMNPEWVLEVIIKGQEIDSVPVLQRLISAVELLPNPLRKEAKPFLEHCLGHGISAAIDLLKEEQ